MKLRIPGSLKGAEYESALPSVNQASTNRQPQESRDEMGNPVSR
jgi:hypothetical protein